MCLSADGSTVWSFGDGDYGKLGLGNTTRVLAPSKIEALQGVTLKKVACGAQFSVALSKDGLVYTWGQGRKNYFSVNIYCHVLEELCHFNSLCCQGILIRLSIFS